MRYSLILCGALLASNVNAVCSITNPNQLLKTIKQNHPLLKESKLSYRSIESNIEQAKQRPNPEMDMEVLGSKEASENKLEASVSLKHTIELGSKRESRIEKAKSLVNLKRSQLTSRDEDILIDAIVKIYRLKQVNKLIPVYEEAQSVFEDIVKLFNSRKSLSPQEEVEKETINLVLSDYQLKLAKLFSERSNVLKHIQFYAGSNCKISDKALDVDININKKYKFSKSLSSYSKLNTAQLRLKFAKSNLELAKSHQYPDLKIGPKFGFSKVGSDQDNSIGLAVTMDLPILNSNKAQVQKRTREIMVAQSQLTNVETEAAIDYKEWKSEFLRYQKSLKSIASYEDLERKHKKVEKLFKRGVISTSFIIESHRQMIQFTTTRHDFELGFIKSLWNLYRLQGKIELQKL